MIYKNSECKRDFFGLFYCSPSFLYFGGVLNKTIPLALVGYEMIIANEARSAELAIIISYPTSARGIIVKCYILHLNRGKRCEDMKDHHNFQ